MLDECLINTSAGWAWHWHLGVGESLRMISIWFLSSWSYQPGMFSLMVFLKKQWNVNNFKLQLSRVTFNRQRFSQCHPDHWVLPVIAREILDKLNTGEIKIYTHNPACSSSSRTHCEDAAFIGFLAGIFHCIKW